MLFYNLDPQHILCKKSIFIEINKKYLFEHCEDCININPCEAEWRIYATMNKPSLVQIMDWANAGILSIGPLGTNFGKFLIEIYAFRSRKCVYVKGKYKTSLLLIVSTNSILYISRLFILHMITYQFENRSHYIYILYKYILGEKRNFLYPLRNVFHVSSL